MFAKTFKHSLKKLRARLKIKVPRGHFMVDVVDYTADMAVRYVISVEFLRCEFFVSLLNEYNEVEANRGPITLACTVGKFEEALYRDRLHSRIAKFDGKREMCRGLDMCI